MNAVHLSLVALREWAGVLFIALCLVSTWYYCYGIYAAHTFFTAPIQSPNYYPPISVLKPVCGLDNDTYENFASFCRQDYPDYQIIFGVHDQLDPCVAIVNQLIKDFPAIDIQLVVSDSVIGTNFKVSNLANAETKAKHPILLLADSDVRVGPDYLWRVVQPMSDPIVGVVTCLYRPLTIGWVATLEAVGISTEYLASVLIANCLEGMSFALGPTIVIRRVTLEAIGGFEAICDFLADDFQLGHRSAQAGYQVVLSDYVIEHVITTESVADLIQRQIRWAFCTRVSRPWGYLGLFFSHGTATSLLFLIATGGTTLSWIGLSITWCTRLAMAWVVGAVGLKDWAARRFLWLVPLSDLISFGFWCYCFFGNTFQWRGRRLKLTKDGKLVAFTKPDRVKPSERPTLKDSELQVQHGPNNWNDDSSR